MAYLGNFDEYKKKMNKLTKHVSGPMGKEVVKHVQESTEKKAAAAEAAKHAEEVAKTAQEQKETSKNEASAPKVQGKREKIKQILRRA